MSDMTIGRSTIKGLEVKKFPLTSQPDGKPWSREAADRYIDRSGLPDNVFLTDGKDCYVVSKKGMNLGLENDGKAVKLDGKAMTIFRSHDNPDTWFQKASLFVRLIPLMVMSGISQAMGRGNGFG